MKRAGILGLAVVLTLGLAVPASQAAKAKRVASDVDIDAAFGPPVTFIGNVYAKKAKCVGNRSVTISVTQKGETSSEPIGTVTTDKTGDWRFIPDASPVGDYVAEVSRKKVGKKGKKLVCKSDTSPAFFWAS